MHVPVDASTIRDQPGATGVVACVSRGRSRIPSLPVRGWHRERKNCGRLMSSLLSSTCRESDMAWLSREMKNEEQETFFFNHTNIFGMLGSLGSAHVALPAGGLPWFER